MGSGLGFEQTEGELGIVLADRIAVLIVVVKGTRKQSECLMLPRPMNRYCFALDLKDDPTLIGEYEAHHQRVWPEIISSLRDSGVENLEIYRVSNRLFMIMEVSDGFSLDRKAVTDAGNPTVQSWEALMWQYQQALPIAKPSEKWVLMERIFHLDPISSSSNGSEKLSEEYSRL